ncbi:MAG: Alkaline phosphatase synthesis sensor protein PhoR [Elusimicrobia bacterium]|nr:Alkaline phosphatase synthesis sensor protein PhoR [Elusimicrobiota bacterium]
MESENNIDRSLMTTILSNMMEGVVAVDTDGRVLFINQALADLFEFDPAQAKGKHLLEVVRQNQLNVLLQNVLQDQKIRTDEVRAFNPDEHIFEAIAVPLIEKGEKVGALMVLHDVTRLRRLEQVRRDFVANVSHELRTPLAAIKGFAETLHAGALKDPKFGMDFVAAIEKQTDNMTALVEDLLDLTAIESGHQNPLKENLDLASVLQEVVEGMAPVAKRKKINIDFKIPEGLPLVFADKKHVKQIFNNLLDNALKFNFEGGRVELRAGVEGPQVKVTVTDSGLGIPAQDIPRIFERFYRVDKARSRAMGGTGLGLSIVKHLVEANGGTVTVSSSAGQGSSFTVLLPYI